LQVFPANSPALIRQISRIPRRDRWDTGTRISAVARIECAFGTEVSDNVRDSPRRCRRLVFDTINVFLRSLAILAEMGSRLSVFGGFEAKIRMASES
jgi:hypothetical protein